MDLICRNLFIDTQYFINKSFDFNGKEFVSLIELVKSGFINVLITDITDLEIKKKIRDSTNLAYEKINVSDARILKVIPAFRDFLNIYDKLGVTNSILVDYENFKKTCSISIVSSDKIKLVDIFESYCKEQPPFNNSNKKNEFPDAFAQQAIVKWAMARREKAYLLSGDPDWKSFANEPSKTWSFKDDDKRFFYLDDLSELLNAIIRHEESLKDLSAFADGLIEAQKDVIELYTVKKLSDCGFIAVSVEDDVDIFEEYILSAQITDKDIISVDREGATYNITFEIKAIFKYEIAEYGPYDNEDKKYLFIEYHPLYKLHIFEHSMNVEFGFYDGIITNFEIISEDLPTDFEIDFEDGEDFELEDWWLDMPVVLYGVSDYKITEDGSGTQEFASFRQAKKIFPGLSVEKSSENFTEALGNKISEPLRFDAHLAHFRSE